MEKPGIPLRAGPLSAAFDGGALRWIRLGDRELVRAIHCAVRGPGWVTVAPRLSALRVEAAEEDFRVSFEALHEHGPLRFAWSGLIEGDRAGTVRFLLEGRAETRFAKNRIGLCVLHPTEGCAGEPCLVEHGDGAVTRGAFPADVAPHQPFLDIRAIRHDAAPGRAVEVRFDGEWFEMEDQRNWSDASFKTYSTPLTLPLPATMEAGQTVRHEVVVRLLEAAPGGGREAIQVAIPAVVAAPRSSSLLQVGLGLTEGRALAPREIDRLRALRLDHLRVELRLDAPDWAATLRLASEQARACGTRLDAAVTVAGDPEAALRRLAEAFAKEAAPVGTVFIFDAASRRSDSRLLALARRALAPAVPAARFGGGPAGPFADLNRNRGAAEGSDIVAFELCPQAHARDEATILENLASLADMARTARGFTGAAALALSPVVLGPRSHPPDPRLLGDFGGRWLRGVLGAAGEAGFASVTLVPAVGAGGIVVEGVDTPAYEALLTRAR